MIDLQKQTKEIVGETVSLEEFRSLDWVEPYLPSNTQPAPPRDEAERKFYNPGIEAFYHEGFEWDNGWTPITDTSILSRFPKYLPTDEAISELISASPLIEIGAGNGYWAHVINENGGDCIPTDLYPFDIPKSEIPVDSDNESEECIFYTSNPRPIYGGSTFPTVIQYGSSPTNIEVMWENVRPASHAVLRRYEEKNVLLCHPPKAEWVEDVLDFISESQRLFYVGEWAPGSDATPRFFKRLHDNWKLYTTFRVYGYQSNHVQGYVFSKKLS